MDRFLPLLYLILLSAAATHAALPAQLYWHTVLPNTPMPSAIRDRLHPADALVDEKTGTTVNVNTGYKKPGGGTTVNVGHGGVGYKVSKYTRIYDVKLFFLEKNLQPGTKMTPGFPTTIHTAAFLSRRLADSLPFSSEKIPDILHRFSVEPNSVKAKAMTKTIQDCEEPAAEGEQRICATSVESMVDFSTANLGTREVRALSTTVGKETEREQVYTVAPGGVTKMAGSELVACHPVAYAYAVFYCHLTRKVKAYSVEMVGENGAKVEAVAVCHEDTTWWNPDHVAFKALKVKPGTVSMCHFLPQDHVVWAHSN